jgi:uncharacterized protein (TIGR00255 family)
MTGFGRASFRVGGSAFEVELRSVNHRHLDARVRLPRVMAALEPQIRTRIQDRFGRGKVDLSVAPPRGDAVPPQLEIDVEAAKQYLRVAAQLRETEGLASRGSSSRSSPPKNSSALAAVRWKRPSTPWPRCAPPKA